MSKHKSNLNIENIQFKSDGITLRGKLITPEAKDNLPVLIMTHGSSATYDMAIIDYAYEISKSGFAVLLYDHPTIGSSDGEPRVEIELWKQARGYRDSISFVETQSNLDSNKINIWGDSFSSWVAMLVSVVDDRVASLIAQTTAIGRRVGTLPLVVKINWLSLRRAGNCAAAKSLMNSFIGSFVLARLAGMLNHLSSSSCQ